MVMLVLDISTKCLRYRYFDEVYLLCCASAYFLIADDVVIYDVCVQFVLLFGFGRMFLS